MGMKSPLGGLRARWRAQRPPLRLEILEDRCLLSGDVVLEWNAIALDALKNDSLLSSPRQDNPGNASRALAIVQAAVFDAVNSIDRTCTPYLIQVNAPAGASVTTAAAQAAHDTLVSLFPEYKTTLDARLAADLSGPGSFLSKLEGVLVGEVVANNILSLRSNDGSSVMMNWPAGTQPGQWQPDPLHPTQSAWGPDWGSVTPFTLTSSTQFSAPPPPALTSQAYAAAYNEVKSLGAVNSTTRTPDETQIGIFWGYDASPGVGAPPRLFNQIAETLAVEMHNTVDQNARFFALVNLAMADAGIEAWNAKYDYDLWRPVTGIRNGASDGNPQTVGDSTWTPLGAEADNGSGVNFTPPFPSYVSGHATFGGALFTVMADFFGRDNIHFTIGSDEYNGVTTGPDGKARPVVYRSYDSFSQAAWECAESRIYIGVHWQFDATAGIQLGTSVGDYVFSHFLLPREMGSHGQDSGADAAASAAAASDGSAPALAGGSKGVSPLEWRPALGFAADFSVNSGNLSGLTVQADSAQASVFASLLGASGLQPDVSASVRSGGQNDSDGGKGF